MGQPGSPGGNDLTKALHRLSLRRQNFLCERQFFQAERERKLQALAGDEDVEGSGCSSPTGSMLSSFSNLSELSTSSSIFKSFLPEKLQIVKPMEGKCTSTKQLEQLKSDLYYMYLSVFFSLLLQVQSIM